MRIGVYAPPDLWRQFRLACLERNVSASSTLTLLMAEQLTRWQEERLREAPAVPARPHNPRTPKKGRP
jgi:hypothetical protein